MLAEILPKIAAEKREPDHRYYPRPSIAGPERCLRSLVYWALDVPPAPLPGRAVMVFDDSSWHEELTADWMRQTAYQLHSQQMTVDTPVGVGHIDGIVTDLLGVDRLYEHKALNHFSFERIWKGEMPVDYLTQCALYMHGVQQVAPAVTEGLLLVKNKNTAQYVEIRFGYLREVDELVLMEMVRSDGQQKPLGGVYPAITRKAAERFRLVEEYRAKSDLPMRPYEYGTDWPCGYCRWAKTCWEGYEREFAERQDTPAVDDRELHEMAIEYVSNARALKVLDDRQDSLKTRIKTRMAMLNAKAALYPEVRVVCDLRRRTELDKSKLPASVLADAQRTVYSEVLSVREAKRDDS